MKSQPSAVFLEAQKIKSDTVSIVSPSIWHEVIIATGKHRFGVLDFVFIEI